jgi:hypothetical protein
MLWNLRVNYRPKGLAATRIIKIYLRLIQGGELTSRFGDIEGAHIETISDEQDPIGSKKHNKEYISIINVRYIVTVEDYLENPIPPSVKASLSIDITPFETHLGRKTSRPTLPTVTRRSNNAPRTYLEASARFGSPRYRKHGPHRSHSAYTHIVITKHLIQCALSQLNVPSTHPLFQPEPASASALMHAKNGGVWWQNSACWKSF